MGYGTIKEPLSHELRTYYQTHSIPGFMTEIKSFDRQFCNLFHRDNFKADFKRDERYNDEHIWELAITQQFRECGNKIGSIARLMGFSETGCGNYKEEEFEEAEYGKFADAGAEKREEDICDALAKANKLPHYSKMQTLNEKLHYLKVIEGFRKKLKSYKKRVRDIIEEYVAAYKQLRES